MSRIASLSALVTTLILACALPIEPLKAELRQSEVFEPEDLVERIEFTIHVGAEGEPLAEPIALDLGLGFPFWLDPIGMEGAEGLPVGARAQEGPEDSEVQPGASATFVFRREGEPGNDPLLSTPQLLDGVRISDISRLGVISRGTNDWQLAGYELKINEETFAARDDVGQKAKEAVELAELAWVDARQALESLAEERDDLSALEEAGLANEEDLARLEALQEQAAPLEKTVAWEEGISLGIHPWFVEEELQVPGRAESGEITEATVIVSTAPQTNAATYNHVYFRTGGRKYFLYPPNNHLSLEASPQSFQLHLAAGPLAASDVRGYSLGMLAHNRPYALAPDRWHPSRLVVEFDGRGVYDSESEPVDQRSFEVIRLVPPVHLDGEGERKVNELNPQECVVWHAGDAQGLDLENGGPAGGVEAFANAEPEPTPGEAVEGVTEGGVAAEGGAVERWEVGAEIPGQGGSCWPGETPIEPDPFLDYPLDDPDLYGDGTDPMAGGGVAWDPGMGAGSPWDPGMGAGNPWDPGMGVGGIPGDLLGGIPAAGDTAAWDELARRLTELVEMILEALGRELSSAIPFGEEPQIENVRLLPMGDDPRLFSVLWAETGDQSQVASYEVDLWHIKPHDGTFVESIDFKSDILPGSQSTYFDLSGMILDPDAYVQPWVTAVMIDGSTVSAPMPEDGPALPWLPAVARAENQPQPGRYDISFTDEVALVAGSTGGPIVDQPPEEGQAGVWSEDVLPNTTDFVGALAAYGITHNVIARGMSNGTSAITIPYSVEEPLQPDRLYELIGHVGFLEWSEDAEPVTVRVRCVLHKAGGGADEDEEFNSEDIQVFRSEPPTLFSILIDPGVYPEGSDPPEIIIEMPEGSNDPAAPLAIYGLRLVPVE